MKRTRPRAMERPVPVKAIEPAKPAVPHCVYCGWPTRRKVACHAHADLPALDPVFSLSSIGPEAYAPRGQEVAA